MKDEKEIKAILQATREDTEDTSWNEGYRVGFICALELVLEDD